MDHSTYNFIFLATLIAEGASFDEVIEFVHEAAIVHKAAGSVFDFTTHIERIRIEGYDPKKKAAVVSYGDLVREIAYDRNKPDDT